MRYLGLNTDRFIFVGIVVAAIYAGLAGALYGLLLRFAFPLLLDWHQSGDFILMTMLGGAGTIFGPLVGAIIFVIGKDIISTITPAWEIFLGAFFVACVLGFPKGILGTIGDAIAVAVAPRAEPTTGRVPPTSADRAAIRSESRTLSDALLDATDVSKHFGGVQAVDRRFDHRRARLDPCRHRAERCRKDDVLQHALRILSFPIPGPCGSTATTSRASRIGAASRAG